MPLPSLGTTRASTPSWSKKAYTTGMTEAQRGAFRTALDGRDYRLQVSGVPNWVVLEGQRDKEEFTVAAKRIREELGIPMRGVKWELTADFGQTTPDITNSGHVTPDITKEEYRVGNCEGCGSTTLSGQHGPKKRFCSDACRKKASRT